MEWNHRSDLKSHFYYINYYYHFNEFKIIEKKWP